jgi:hypothetical protein
MFDSEENWFSIEDVANIPDIISDIDCLRNEIQEFTLWLELKRHSDLMRQAT